MIKVLKRKNAKGHSRFMFTESHEKDIIDRIQNKHQTVVEISKIYGVSIIPIRRILKENNISTKVNYIERNDLKRTLVTSFFDTIDTEEKAYFLGLLYADGCVLDKGARQKRMAISLKESDRHILEKFRTLLKHEKQLICMNKELHGKYFKHYKLLVNSDKLCNALISHGCTPRKSFTLDFPKTIPDSLMRHFLRGLFDGDGSIHSYIEKGKKMPRFTFSITGSWLICNGVNNWLNKILGFKHRKISKQKNVFGYGLTGGCQIEKLYHYLYDNCNPELYLIRKYNIFKKILDHKHNPVIKSSKYINVSKSKKAWVAVKYTTDTYNIIRRCKTEFEAYIALCNYEKVNNLPFANDATEYYNYIKSHHS